MVPPREFLVDGVAVVVVVEVLVAVFEIVVVVVVAVVDAALVGHLSREKSPVAATVGVVAVGLKTV